jgi:predicted O-linked N-acetylglucosamine transferase (SPINDLY family)
VRDPERPLRVGFLSPDFRCHPVGYFLIRVLENLHRGQYKTVCYCDQQTEDDLTVRFRAAAAIWRDVAGQSDERLAEQVRADRIDILFDLAGHTAYNRLLVFARKPAPVQITWIGYEGTTGLAAMDYLLADRHVVPAGAERYYREGVIRLPDGYLCCRGSSRASGPVALDLVFRESGDISESGCWSGPVSLQRRCHHL